MSGKEEESQRIARITRMERFHSCDPGDSLAKVSLGATYFTVAQARRPNESRKSQGRLSSVGVGKTILLGGVSFKLTVQRVQADKFRAEPLVQRRLEVIAPGHRVQKDTEAVFVRPLTET